MQSWFRLLVLTLGVILFVATMWLLPVGLFAVATVCFTTLWMRIVLVAMGVLWWVMFRPWVIFRGERWHGFLRSLREAFKTLFL